jgi:hypothetical protein
VHTPVVDVGKLINQHAQTCASIIAAVLGVALLAWLRRTARRRRVMGVMHCRRCDYNVTGIAPAGAAQPRCPECGVDLAERSPLPGRSARRRLWLPVTLLALVTIPYAWYMLPVGHNTFPRPIPEGRWGSTTLLRWSSASWLAWISKSSTPGELLLELDTQTGVTRRAVATRASQTYFPLQYNRFATAVCLSRGLSSFDLVSVESGRVVASLAGNMPSPVGTGDPFMTGYDKAGAKVYLDCSGLKNANSWITEWDWRSGNTRQLGVVAALSSTKYASPPHHTLIPGEPIRFLRYTSFGEAYDTKHYRLAILDADGAVVKEVDLGEGVDSMAKPTFSPGGERFFLTSKYGRGLRAYDAHTLELIGEVSAGIGGGDAYAPISADGRLILLAEHRGIIVRDTQRKAWASTLVFPSEVYAAHSLNFSDDGRTVCAVFQSGGRTSALASPPGYVFQLGVWKLPELPAPPVEPSPAPSTPTKPQQ